MIEMNLEFPLPLPWNNQTFKATQVGPINFLVGPNGSGKSRFANELIGQLKSAGNARLLGTDRLSEMRGPGAISRFIGDHFGKGFAKNWFPDLKTAGAQGSGIDTIVLLEERMDLRMQVEATLSHLFDREIVLEWDSGNLIPKVERRQDRISYRLDRDECHGIKELLVLLTHLYDPNNKYLIIDEPELNLHPQYQAFFMQEVRKLAGNPQTETEKKAFFLITHSPYILEFRTDEDLNSVISFDLAYSTPKQIKNLDLNPPISLAFTKRLNAHHKELFFSDNPIFVEGILDSQLIAAMMEARGVSVAGAGSCIIDAGGVEEVNQYFRLCQGLEKSAHFLYDLDSLFRGNLRACINDDESVQSLLASAGLGNDFGQYCGQLDKKLTCLVKKLLGESSLSKSLGPLEEFLKNLGEMSQWNPKQWAKARIAVLTAISKYREDIVPAVSQTLVEDIEGRLEQILNALGEKNMHVLPGGTLERYLPHYEGDDYSLNENTKRKAVDKEIEELANLSTEEDLLNRYKQLYEVVCNLPSKTNVKIEPVLRNYLGNYIHQFQKIVVDNPDWDQNEIQNRLNALQPGLAGVFFIGKLERLAENEFSATIEITEMLGQAKKFTEVSHRTNAGMGSFEIVDADSTHH